MGLLAAAVAFRSLPLFLLATATSGAGYSLLFVSALGLINGAAPAALRGGVLSMLNLFAYLSMGAVALVLGAVATAWSLAVAIDLGSGVIAALSLITIVFAARISPPISPPIGTP
jgi:hypothetical protein